MFYFRRKGEKRIRLPFPNDPEFTTAYVSAYAGFSVDSLVIKPPTREPKTLRWLIEKYRQTAYWASLALNTRKSMDTYFDQVIQKSGSFDYRKVTPNHIRQGLEKRKNTPASAVQFLSAMRVLFKWALKNSYITTDPCIGIERPRFKSDGIKTWTIEELQQLKNFWDEGTPMQEEGTPMQHQVTIPSPVLHNSNSNTLGHEIGNSVLQNQYGSGLKSS